MSTYVPIQAITLSSTAASVTFSGIPQTYTDLIIVGNFGTTSGNANIALQVGNGSIDTGNNYSFTHLNGDGSTAASGRVSNTAQIYIDYSAYAVGTLTSVYTWQFQNYSNTTTNKTVLGRANTAGRGTNATVGLWRSTSAINQIKLDTQSTTFLVGSTFTLYGVGTGSPKAFGGDEVRTDGTYWYHIYRSSGIFAPMQDLSCDYLVVAGGGASGYRTNNDDYYCGGGGGGGLLTSVGTSGGNASAGSAVSLNSGNNYTVTIGAGGTKVSNASGTAGNNSVFASITATGGGFGGYGNGGTFNTYPGGNGGSGGGSNGGDFGGNGGSAVSPTQGYAGGTVTLPSGDATGGGGGGGAGSAGGSVSASRSNGGNGGAPLANSLSGSSVYYAGGGRGGRGYTASNGSNDANYSYAANTGSGGYPNAGTNENGCSGIVIVRYAV